ncbi:transglutaminase-like domain-containing protein [Arthrospiribacter ruber]|uniref:Transglutaminase family protein n=1 Tax=Arthrospiribacter ruber TaxID=2487934 RepID=A0A951IXD5_9BACT|nr:transglutaminase family protein [Arthrospiribacter ruber]MBW3467807.1 transglutaminase family protein [Arthrospiribacter ruber]
MISSRQATTFLLNELNFHYFFNRYFWMRIFAVFSAMVLSFFVEAQIPEGIDYHEIVRTWSNDNGVYDFPDHVSATYEQTVEQLSETESVITIKSAKSFPEFSSGLPVDDIPEGMEAYLAHDNFIQRDAQEIIETAELIKREGTYSDLFTLVINVLYWTGHHLSYGNTSDIPDAVKAYNEQIANCIGYVHLSAAILRQMGVPARTVRTLIPIADRGATRHYLLEVYFPEDETWVTFEPQTLSPPMGGNTVAYSDATWNQSKHEVSRDFSRDENTSIRRGMPYVISPTPEIGQWPRLDPEDVSISNQRVIGLTLTGNEDYFATLAYPPASPGPSYNKDAQSDRSALRIYGHDATQNPTVQHLIPADDFGSAIDANGGLSEANKITAGAIDRYSGLSRAHLGPNITMNDQWLVIAMHYKGSEMKEGAVFRPLPKGSFTQRDSVHMGMLMMYKLGEDGQWSHSHNVVQPFLGERNRFGSAVVFQNDLMLVSAPSTTVEASMGGEIQLYRLREDEWLFEETITEPESNLRQSDYGRIMHSDGDHLAVSSNEGVYIYNFAGNHIERESLIEIDIEGIAPEFKPHDIHISKNRLLIGLGDAELRGESSGAVLVYEKEDGEWLHAALLAPDELMRNDQFGANVLEIDGMIVATAHNQGTSFSENAGAIYVFNQVESEVWVPTDYLTIENPIENPLVPYLDENIHRENVGLNTLLFGGELIASATGHFVGSMTGKRMGSFYRFALPEPIHRLRKIREADNELSTIIDLQPNPVVTLTEIIFTLPESGKVELKVSSNDEGVQMKLVDEILEAGTYQIGADLLELSPGSYRLDLITSKGVDHFDLLRIARTQLEEIE